ncbi:hypothetical protein [Dactylosporangium darangshiense]|uniref:Nucleotidyltransferase family protein n=1 Tax=Dactylosporangium darangshiense TaxID=579108 RepID=A0ABP8CZY1_9ACTN
MNHNGALTPFRDPADLRRILTLLLDLLDPRAQGFEYRLVGTAAALAQGVPLPTGDIDILMHHRADVDRFAAALSSYRCLSPPEWLPAAAQYFTHFDLEGYEVGASTVEHPTSADTLECIGTGPWTHYVEVPLDRHTVPAVRLELRLVSELVRNRPDRYTPLLAHMRTHTPDRALIERAMHDRNVPEDLRQHVTAQLTPA